MEEPQDVPSDQSVPEGGQGGANAGVPGGFQGGPGGAPGGPPPPPPPGPMPGGYPAPPGGGAPGGAPPAPMPGGYPGQMGGGAPLGPVPGGYPAAMGDASGGGSTTRLIVILFSLLIIIFLVALTATDKYMCVDPESASVQTFGTHRYTSLTRDQRIELAKMNILSLVLLAFTSLLSIVQTAGLGLHGLVLLKGKKFAKPATILTMFMSLLLFISILIARVNFPYTVNTLFQWDVSYKLLVAAFVLSLLNSALLILPKVQTKGGIKTVFSDAKIKLADREKILRFSSLLCSIIILILAVLAQVDDKYFDDPFFVPKRYIGDNRNEVQWGVCSFGVFKRLGLNPTFYQLKSIKVSLLKIVIFVFALILICITIANTVLNLIIVLKDKVALKVPVLVLSAISCALCICILTLWKFDLDEFTKNKFDSTTPDTITTTPRPMSEQLAWFELSPYIKEWGFSFNAIIACLVFAAITIVLNIMSMVAARNRPSSLGGGPFINNNNNMAMQSIPPPPVASSPPSD